MNCIVQNQGENPDISGNLNGMVKTYVVFLSPERNIVDVISLVGFQP